MYGVFCSLNGEELYYKGERYYSGEILNKDVFDNKIVIRFNNGVDFVAEKNVIGVVGFDALLKFVKS